MKKMTVPENIKMLVLNKETKQPEEVSLSFTKYLIDNPLQHHVWGTNYDTLDTSDRLIKFLSSPQAPKPGEELVVSDEIWYRLDEIVNHPTQPYNPSIARGFLPFFKAVKDAEDCDD